MNTEHVIKPDKLGIRLRRHEDNSLEIEPIICKIEIQENGQEVVQPLDSANAFIEVFDRLSTERDTYPIPNGPRIVLDDNQKNALGQFRSIHRVSGAQKEALIANPQAFFDPDVVYLDDFSDRVQEIGEYRPRVFPFLRPQKEAWLPPEGGILIDGTMVYVPLDEVDDLKKRVEAAISIGKQTVEWKGQYIPTTVETVQALRELSEWKKPHSSEPSPPRIEGRQSKILIIKDNFEEADHSPGRHPRPGAYKTPSSLREEVILLPHQREGLYWLQKLWLEGANGALLADDMGLGKTLQALAFLGWCRELMDVGEFPVKPMLIVAPVVLLENWKSEYDHFLNPIFGPFLELHGSGLRRFRRQDVADVLAIRREVDVKEHENAEALIRSGRGLLLWHDEIARAGAVLTTYETLRDYQFSLGLIEWGVMIIDEAQKVKTPSAMVTLAIKAMKYDFGIAMTGTPVENSWVDLWSLMDFVQPGRLGSLKEFVAEFQTPLKREDTDRGRLGQKLKSRVDPLLKRRLKEDHLEGLPEKIIRDYMVEMPKIQIDRYLGLVEQARKNLPEPLNPGRKQHILSVIAALRDISLCPYLPFHDDHGLSAFSDDEIVQSSGRLQKTMEALGEVRKRQEKVIIFLTSRKMQRLLQRILKNCFGIHVHIINGEITGGRRQGLVDAFQETQGYSVIIMSPEAAGVSLNVTAANHVIHLSRPWNPAKEDQATDRVYRIGQKRDVVVHLPLAVHPVLDNELCKGSFDQKLHRLLEEKRKLS
ncbi:MAG: DEAD/DEAH box helicase, partial [Candidatus Tectomicrobia bacterium]|nr:DEAD/DEAH box helicase [Candidatus Tectomicrobia bacterium]